MVTGQDFEHNDACGPNISFLGIGECIADLLRWFVEKGPTLQEISDRFTRLVLGGKTEVDDLHQAQIVVVTD